MEHYYKAYSKIIDNTTFYFVKKYSHFPEIKDIPAILEKFGMHENFKKACIIAEVFDPVIIENLYEEATANIAAEKEVIVIENQPKTTTVEKSVFAHKFNLIKKNFTSRITHWHLMPH